MNASETVWACIAVAVGLLVVATRGWDAWHRPRTHRRFQQTAADAALAYDAEQQAADAKFAQIIAAEFPAGIPHQTRRHPRTEDNQ